MLRLGRSEYIKVAACGVTSRELAVVQFVQPCGTVPPFASEHRDDDRVTRCLSSLCALEQIKLLDNRVQIAEAGVFEEFVHARQPRTDQAQYRVQRAPDTGVRRRKGQAE